MLALNNGPVLTVLPCLSWPAGAPPCLGWLACTRPVHKLCACKPPCTPLASLHGVQVQNADLHMCCMCKCIFFCTECCRRRGGCKVLARTTHRVCRYRPCTRSSCSRTDPSVGGTNPCLRKAFLPSKLEAKTPRLWGTLRFYPTSKLFLSLTPPRTHGCSLSSPNWFLTLKITRRIAFYTPQAGQWKAFVQQTLWLDL